MVWNSPNPLQWPPSWFFTSTSPSKFLAHLTPSWYLLPSPLELTLWASRNNCQNNATKVVHQKGHTWSGSQGIGPHQQLGPKNHLSKSPHPASQIHNAGEESPLQLPREKKNSTTGPCLPEKENNRNGKNVASSSQCSCWHLKSSSVFNLYWGWIAGQNVFLKRNTDLERMEELCSKT